MSAVKSRSALRALVLTPERIPTFIIPSRSRDRIRLLSDHDDQSPDGCSSSPAAAAAASPRFHFRLAPPRIRLPHRSSDAAAEAAAAADTDVTTRAAMSLPHVGKVSAPYGFRAVLAASPCTRRRESMYHRNKAVTVTVTDVDSDPADPPPPPPLPLPPAGSAPRRSRVCLRPVKELGLQVMKELKKSGAALRALSPARKTDTL